MWVKTKFITFINHFNVFSLKKEMENLQIYENIGYTRAREKR